MSLTVPDPTVPTVEATPPRCGACDRPIHQNAELRGRGVVRRTEQHAGVVDPTWRHEDGTVAVAPDGTPLCTGLGGTALTNQGQPVHGDQVPYAAARRDLLTVDMDLIRGAVALVAGAGAEGRVS